MRFQVPQFIEHEPKVVGPFTFRQFIYIAVPSAMGFFLYFTAPFSIFAGGTALLVFIGFCLGFLQINGKSLPGLIVNILGFSISPKTYIWKKNMSRGNADALAKYDETPQEQVISKQIKLTKESSLKNLSNQMK